MEALTKDRFELAFPGGGGGEHIAFYLRCFERGDNWCRAWRGALEKLVPNERHNLQLPKPGGGGFYPPPAARIQEAAEQEQSGRSGPCRSTMPHNIASPREPAGATGAKPGALKAILQSAI